ncbi:hypothetical protein ACQ86I_05815 [Prescottella equi]
MTADDWPVEILRDRVDRAGELRAEIGHVWNEYLATKPRQLGAVPASDDSWFFVIKTVQPMPTRLSTLFGEWLYELRSALDGLAYHLAVRDSGKNPPPAEPGIYFPIFTDAEKFDSRDHRGRMKALSDDTFRLLRHIQPFNAAPDHMSNVLWWLNRLAMIDRHRRGHALAAHIVNIRVGLAEPLQLVRSLAPDPFRPIPVDESEPTPILEFKAPLGWSEMQIRDHIDYSNATSNVLDVTEWARDASRPMARLELEQRMRWCESYILDEIINPLVNGDISLLNTVESECD